MLGRELPYVPLIRAAASRWGTIYGVALEPALVQAVIAVESAFRPDAKRTEPDGRVSRGLMQVLEGTARDMGLTDPLRLHEPPVGIDFGVRYLARQLARYRGNVASALAAYNAGSARRTASGAFVNQRYVDKVGRLVRLYAAAPAAAGGGALALGVLLLVLFGRGLALARR